MKGRGQQIIGAIALAAVCLGFMLYVVRDHTSGRFWYRNNHVFLDKIHGLIGVTPGRVEVTAEDHRLGRCSHPIPKGITEDRVRAVMGEPTQVLTPADAAKGLHPLPGYAAKNRPISRRVLVYISGDAIGYIWINEKGEVEDLFTGPS